MTLNLTEEANRWVDAICTTTDPDMFFEKETEAQAKAVCRECPIVVMCAQYAIDNEISDGVWGGLSSLDRKTLRNPVK
jgi:WhiB family redox-sensing transcriptional regulator